MIHLSHAKNFALYGSIGLSPGDRTEAMSSPLNFLISQAWFLISPNTSYATYLDFYNILILAFFALSYTFCVAEILKKIKKLEQTPYWLVSIFPLAMVLASWTTFGWMISGMENALSASLMLLLFGVVFSEQKKRIYLVHLIIALIGIARIEFAVILFPLFSGILFQLRDSRASWKRLVFDLAPILLVWGIFHGARYIYFGQLSPNTAQALGKSASVTMVIFLLTQFYLLTRIMGLTKSLNSKIGYLIFIIHFCAFARIVHGNLDENDFNPSASISVSAFLIIIAMVTYSNYQFNMTMQTTILLFTSQLNEYFLFGPARLSEFRIVAIFAPALLVLGYKLLLDYYNKSKYNRKDFCLVLVLPLIPLAFLVLSKADPVRNLCCQISPSENLIIKEAKDFLGANQLTQSAKPISASPDLGKLSFAKETIIVDLGLIGDPLLGSLALNHPEKVARFLNDFVSPDIVESHGFWSCRYANFLESAEFKKNYQITHVGIESTEFNVPRQSACPYSGSYRIWTRLLPEKESLFAYELNSNSVSDFPKIIEAEVTNCVQESLELKRCQYVYRGVLREIERVNKSKVSSEIFQSLESSPTYKLDSLRLEKRSNWLKAAEQEVLALIN